MKKNRILALLLCFALMLGVYILGARDALISCLLYLAVGAVGLPVFSNFGSGIPVLIGPTGGYLVGYLLFVGVSGLIMKLGKGRRLIDALGFITGTALLYALGTVWFMIQMKTGLTASLIACVLPFIPGDLLKIAAALMLGPVLAKRTDSVRSKV